MKTDLSPSLKRQQWLDKADAALVQWFASKGYKVPLNRRCSVGFPKGGSGRRHAIGQCWPEAASGDGHFETFISPELQDSVEVLATQAHEYAHATVGLAAGHKAPFKKCAEAIGLTGKMTATVAGPEFKEWSAKLVEKIGQFPGAKLNVGSGRFKKQSTRLLKCECEQCGYTARVTKKWIESVGAPVCPADEIPLSCDSV